MISWPLQPRPYRERAEADARLSDANFGRLEKERFDERLRIVGWNYAEAMRCAERAARSLAKERMEAA